MECNMTTPRIFGYVVNLNERGSFYADVRDLDDKTLYEVKSNDEDGEIFEVESGFMKHAQDIKGLLEHLIDVGVLQKGDYLVEGRHFDKLQGKYERGELNNDEDLEP
jgi:hypothetical protein